MCPDSCTNLELNVQLGVGSPAALAQHMARIQLTQRAIFFLALFGLHMLEWKNRVVPRVREEGRPLRWSSWLPSGTPGISDPREGLLFA